MSNSEASHAEGTPPGEGPTWYLFLPIHLQRTIHLAVACWPHLHIAGRITRYTGGTTAKSTMASFMTACYTPGLAMCIQIHAQHSQSHISLPMQSMMHVAADTTDTRVQTPQCHHASWPGLVLEGAPDGRHHGHLHQCFTRYSCQACKSAGSKGHHALLRMA